MRRGPRVNYDASRIVRYPALSGTRGECGVLGAGWRAPDRFEQDLGAWLEIIRRRDTCSQSQAIADAAQRDIADPSMARSRQNRLCLVRIRGEMPSGG